MTGKQEARTISREMSGAQVFRVNAHVTLKVKLKANTENWEENIKAQGKLTQRISTTLHRPTVTNRHTQNSLPNRMHIFHNYT